MSKRSRVLLLIFSLVFLCCGNAYAQAPTITSISPTSGPIGTLVQITGTNLGATQGSSTVSLNSTSAVVVTWSSTAITALVPPGSTSGPFSVTVNGQNANSTSFTVTTLPSGWTDGDIGSVGLAGSASYASGVFTVKGAGPGIYGGLTSDAFNYVYLPLSGDGTVVARVVSTTGGTTYESAGVMIRETLSPGATNGFTSVWVASSEAIFSYRTTTGGGTSTVGAQSSLNPPYWVKLVRSGSTFSGYVSPDGVNWLQGGSTQTIAMAQNAYIGLGVTSGSTSSLATATFDNVSVTSPTNLGPLITGLSATTGPVGTQVTILGSGFGATGLVELSGALVTINSWSSTSITITLPTGARSGPLVVSVAPGMDNSNPVIFTVTSQPLPSGWFDQDVGQVGVAGNSTFSNGVFTVQGAGTVSYSGGTSDAFHFVYLPLSGDGTIVARLVSITGGSGYETVEVMIRETLSPAATNGQAYFYETGYYGGSGQAALSYRTTTGGSSSATSGPSSLNAPYWLKLVRSGGTFSGFGSSDGVNWVQFGTDEGVDMAQNVYVGLGVNSGSTTSLTTATFDSVSVSSTANPGPVITGVSATTGSVGSQVTVSGSGFGASQGNSVVMIHGAAMAVNSWSDSSIVFTIPAGTTSGLLLVSVAPSMNDSNPVFFTVTTQPLPSGWFDQDVGQVGVAGSATYASGVFTIQGSGTSISSTADGMHFVYQPLSGNGTIVARLDSISGTAGYASAGVMIRETLNASSTNAYVGYGGGFADLIFQDRTSTGASTSILADASVTLPYWVMLVRSGSTFSAYTAADGVNWTQLGSSQTITMAQNAYVGLATSSYNNSALRTGVLDNVSVTSTVNPGPVILSMSATTGSVGNQVLISGSGFGASQGNSLVTVNGAAMTINSWSASSITFTIPSGATSGYLVVSVAPSMNDSNPVVFTVTTQPLPSPWDDQDVGQVGLAGSASYSNGTFTLNASGTSISSTADGMHFVFQPLSGDATFIARVVSISGTAGYASAGIMIRETLNASSKNAYVGYGGGFADVIFQDRNSTGGTTSIIGDVSTTLPYWVKLVRSGNIFSAFASPNGSTWTQLGTSQTVTMAQTLYVGLAASSYNNSALRTATIDSLSLTEGLMPFVSGLSPTSGGVGASITVNGTSFGATQGTSTITFNGTAPASISSWSNSQIVAVMPSTIRTGPVVVTVGSVASNSNVVFTAYNPVINNLTPPAAAPGDTITISGYGFGTDAVPSTVQFNAVNAEWSSWNDTNLPVQVPMSATSGPVTVTIGGVTSNGVQFTVIEPLSVTGVSPSAGPLGATVTISGAGFGPAQSNSTVTFNGTTATATNWSDTSITTTVPTGASTGPVTVAVANTTGIGPTFEVTGSLTLTDSLGHQTSYSTGLVGGKWYVSSGQGSGCSTCTVRGQIQNQFDNLGNILSTTDELGRVTTYTYDSNYNVASVTQPAVGGSSPKTTDTYNSFGEVLTMTDPLGHATTNSYDSHGNLLSVTLPGPTATTTPSITQFAYNSLGEMTQITDPLGRITKLTYTTAGLIATISDPQSNVTTYQYNSHGDRTSITDALNNQTTFAYDSGDRLTTITYPGSTTSTFTYDYRGRRITATDQNGKTTTYAYDDADRLTSVTDAASHVTQYAYDTENNLVSITDANSHTTSFSYDAFGRVTQTTFTSNYYETYAYDSVGNLTSRTDRKGQTIQYVYDALNRLTQKSYPDSTSVEYTYDLVGKVLQVNDPTGTYGFAYDNMGRLLGTTTAYSFLPNTPFSNSYTYDAASNRTGFTAPDGSTNTYTYDTLNRLSTLANSWAGSFGFSYDALSRRTQMTRPNNVTTKYTYDNLSRLLSVLHQLSGSTIDGATYTVDAAGNRTAKTDNRANVTSNYTYDPIYELTGVTQGSNTTESYTYDPVGNRLSSLGVSSYTNNSSNELTSSSSASYAYDYNGNTTSKTVSGNTTNYTWDYENRVASVVLPGTGGTATFKYDPFGRRIQKIFTQNSTTTTTNYLYDGDDSVEEIDQNGNVLARFSRTTNIDEPLAESRSGTTSYYQQDGLGSATSLSNSAGALVSTYTFDSFGNLTSSTGSLTNTFRYTARELDSETGLHFYRARYYDPAVGRFLSEDPIDYLGGVNFYRYVRNNPPKYRDPYGKDPVIGGIVGIIAGGIYGGLGARLACGSTRDIVIAVIVGAGLGGITGALDPSFGVATLAVVGGISGGAGDLAGQLIATGGTSVSLGETGGAIVGGAIGGAAGGAIGAAGAAAGLPELPVTAGGASIGGGITASLTGAATVAANPHQCGCK